jgi:predicted peptidase
MNTMKKKFMCLITLILVTASAISVLAEPGNRTFLDAEILSGGEYIIVVNGYDWGPGVSKVILNMGERVQEVDQDQYVVFASRSSECVEIQGAAASGERTILAAYVSDEKGSRIDSGMYVTLILQVSPMIPLSNPFVYVRGGGENCRGNVWTDYRMTIVNKATNRVWNVKAGRYSQELERFDMTGRFSSKEGIDFSYAFHKPEAKQEKIPLIIWLHGGGEGGTDTSIPLLANRAANYASEDIQAVFKGAYVLVPQCPGAWMHNTKGVMTHGAEEDVYHVALMELIKAFVAARPDIDTDRIYVGGCSNGGYMSLKLILEHPGYFAAGYISALAYQSQYISDEQMKSIRHVPIWFVHAADDGVTLPEKTVLPVYKRLLEAGAKNVHLSYYDHVIDLTGLFGGADYHYYGHGSWAYCHVNHCWQDYDGSEVEIDGKPVHIMQWMAAQKK